MNRRHFTINSIEETLYIMTDRDLHRSIVESVDKDVSLIVVEGDVDDVTVHCDPNYMHELMAGSYWSQRHPNNYEEDTFGGGGQVFKSPDEKHTSIVLRFTTKIVADERSKTHVKSSADANLANYRQLAGIERCLSATDFDFMRRFGPVKFVLRGHYHTELGIGVKPSGIDFEDHISSIEYPDMPWLTQIIDPVRCMSGIYIYKEGKMVRPRVVYYFYPGDRAVWEGYESYRYKRKSPGVFPEQIRKVIKPSEEEEADVRGTTECSEPDSATEQTEGLPSNYGDQQLPENEGNDGDDTKGDESAEDCSAPMKMRWLIKKFFQFPRLLCNHSNQTLPANKQNYAKQTALHANNT